MKDIFKRMVVNTIKIYMSIQMRIIRITIYKNSNLIIQWMIVLGAYRT